MNVASPCVGTCVLNEGRICGGCYRSADEISGWRAADAAIRCRTLRAATRRAAGRNASDGVEVPSEDEIRARLNSLCKPPGSLGELERLAAELCRIQRTLRPLTRPRRVVVFAADHGVARSGVSAWPSEVTAAVTDVMAQGRSASGVFAAALDADYSLVDVGCLRSPRTADDMLGRVRLVSRPPAKGTADLSQGPAMTPAQFNAAWKVGVDEADAAANAGMRLVIAGEMGIGNTTSAACLTALLAGVAPAAAVGRGAGIDDDGLRIKQQVVADAVRRCEPFVRSGDWTGTACSVGGFEIVAMAGFYVRAGRRGLPIVLDGFISTAAALLAERLVPGTSRSMIAAHLSTEPGHVAALEQLALRPMLDLQMRLGEATGALVLLPLLDLAAAMINDMATLDDLVLDPAEPGCGG